MSKHIRAVLLVIAVGLISSMGAVAVFADASDSTPASQPTVVEEKIVTYDDVLASIHRGQWFGWLDSDNKNYENLVVLDLQYSKPTKAELLAAQSALQLLWDTRTVDRAALLDKRSAIEANILADTYTTDDLVDYLRILGGF